jgi:hypothetical protein
LVTAETNPTTYFAAKGYNTICPMKQNDITLVTVFKESYKKLDT